MKNKYFNTFLLLAGIAIAFLACRKDFKDINIDPSDPNLTQVQTRFLLASAIKSVPDVCFGNNSGNFYVQYLAEGPYPGGSLYSTKNFNWSGFYTDPLYNLEQMLKFANGNKPEAAPINNGHLDNQKAVAIILKSYFFLFMTDRWGDIPYKEALKGSDNFLPSYTKQQEIYDDIFNKLATAVSSIKETELGVQGDLLLGGNMLMWKKFANTIRMDMALRLSEKDPTRGKAEFEAAINASGGVISKNGENINWNYLDDPNYYNPWYSNYSVNNRNDYAISKTLADYMLPKNDKRIKVYAETLAGSRPYQGLAYGTTSAVNIPNRYSRIGDAFRDKTSPARVFNYPQVLFMMAEAKKIGYLPGGDVAAEADYTKAIKASWEMNGVYNDVDFVAYVATVPYKATEGVKVIITEKWVHNYLNGYAAWNDWRRTGFPTLTKAVDAVDSRGIPVRQGYPVNEKSLNEKNYLSAVSAMGGTDDNYTKVWWHK